MGVDVRLRAALEGADLSAARAALAVHDPHGWIELGLRRPADRRYVFVESLHRYFDDGYERGYWPQIRAMIVALQPHLSDLEYGSDQGHFAGELVDDRLLARLDTLWLHTVRGRSDAAARRELPPSLSLASRRRGDATVYTLSLGDLAAEYEMTEAEEFERALTGANPDKHHAAVELLAPRR